MNSLDISLDKNSYQIFIKQNIFKSITDYIPNSGEYNQVFIISQKSITDIYIADREPLSCLTFPLPPLPRNVSWLGSIRPCSKSGHQIMTQ